jgi:hypothetical protein
MMQAHLLTADLHGAMMAGKHFHSSFLQLEMLPNGLVVCFFIPWTTEWLHVVCVFKLLRKGLLMWQWLSQRVRVTGGRMASWSEKLRTHLAS